MLTPEQKTEVIKACNESLSSLRKAKRIAVYVLNKYVMPDPDPMFRANLLITDAMDEFEKVIDTVTGVKKGKKNGRT
jgi:hypothetical protein